MESNFLENIFRKARSPRTWTPQSFDLSLLEKIINDANLGPTSANCEPLRIVFVHSKEAKEKLLPCLMPGNVERTRQAFITAIFAYDLKFYENLPRLYPHADMRKVFLNNEEMAWQTAFRNSTLQAAYVMMVTRAYGLDCGPMSGFNNQEVDEIFLKDTTWKSNFLCNIGRGEESTLLPRDVRLTFAEMARIV